MTLDDPTAGHDETGRVEIEARDGSCRFADEHPLIARGRPGDVPQSFYRMHGHDANAPKYKLCRRQRGALASLE